MAEATSKIVTDIGVSDRDAKENRSVILHFAPVTLEDGKATATGDTFTVRHFVQANSATMKATKIPAGDYALSRIEYNLRGSNFERKNLDGTNSSREYYRSYCLSERTLAFTVTPEETGYLGQIALNLPSKVPSKAANLVPIKGMTFDLASAQNSLQWTYGEATLIPVKSVKIANPDTACSSRAHRVAGWQTPQSGS
ncbi:hypothetical protein RYZ27_03450 [Hyphomonas sp. FCG-A18]|uniref:hypothetical protein n=1 Tax=Hyphomonas sp. FCG-A18 TaxID=3080019 RepID=UPI002B310A39|nr:hypothetical protein RYZ27_03450 [Hyphomonas sp. FCG-A18]